MLNCFLFDFLLCYFVIEILDFSVLRIYMCLYNSTFMIARNDFKNNGIIKIL